MNRQAQRTARRVADDGAMHCERAVLEDARGRPESVPLPALGAGEGQADELAGVAVERRAHNGVAAVAEGDADWEGRKRFFDRGGDADRDLARIVALDDRDALFHRARASRDPGPRRPLSMSLRVKGLRAPLTAGTAEYRAAGPSVQAYEVNIAGSGVGVNRTGRRLISG